MMEKVTHPESISETFYTLGILIDQIATSQLVISYNKDPSDWCLHDPKEHKEERDLHGN